MSDTYFYKCVFLCFVVVQKLKKASEIATINIFTLWSLVLSWCRCLWSETMGEHSQFLGPETVFTTPFFLISRAELQCSNANDAVLSTHNMPDKSWLYANNPTNQGYETLTLLSLRPCRTNHQKLSFCLHGTLLYSDAAYPLCRSTVGS